MTKHTPLPWKIEGWRDGKIRIYSYGAPRELMIVQVLHPDPKIAEATAALIVRACNSHEELVEALKAALRGCPCSIKERHSGHHVECFAAQVDAAIAKAEGES